MVEDTSDADQGGAAYIFVSYSHDDSDLVYPELDWLRAQGFNVWYDQGIAPGSSWREEIATAINECALFLMFVTPRSVKSEPCQREINFAESHNRRILAVHLEKTELPMGLELVLGDRQAIMRYQLSASAYYDKLSNGLELHVRSDKAEASSPVTDRERRRNPFMLATVGLVLAFATYALWQWQDTDESVLPVAQERLPGDRGASTKAAIETSIMVIPFDDLSPSNENAYFAAGMYEDVLHRISSSLGIPVIARNTAMKFSGTSKSPREIGTELGITHLLTGNVRRAGNQVRINVQLISTDSERQLWSDSYDEQLDDIFAIQSDVATKIAGKLQVNINEAAATKLATKPTDNLAAYDLYLQGRELARPGTTAGNAEAMRLFQQTIELAPEFAEAHARLAIALADTQGEWDRASALQEAELALSLNAGISEVQFAMARVLVRDNRVEEAFAYFEQAIALNPSNSRIRMAYGKAYESRFDIVNANAQWEKSLSLDPLSAETIMQISHTLETEATLKAMQGLEHDYLPATKYFRRAVTLEPNNLGVLRELMNHLWRVGQQIESLRVALQIHEIDPTNFVAINQIVQTFINIGQGEAARQWIARLPGPLLHQRNALSAQLLRREGNFSDALAFTRVWFEGHSENQIAKIQHAFTLIYVSGELSGPEATRSRELARQLLSDFVTDETGSYHVVVDTPAMGLVLMEDWWVMSAELILADALGDVKNAQTMARLIIDRYETQLFRRTGNSLHAALAYTILGDRDTAIEKVQELERLGVAFYSRYILTNWFEENHPNDMDLSNDAAYELAVLKMAQRNGGLAARLSAELPELYADAGSSSRE